MIVHNYKSIFFFRLLFKNAEKNCLFASLLPTDRMCTVGRQKQICVYEHKHCEFHKFPFVLVIKNLSTRSWHKSASVWTVFFPFVFKVFFTHANNLSVAFRFKKKKKKLILLQLPFSATISVGKVESKWFVLLSSHNSTTNCRPGACGCI